MADFSSLRNEEPKMPEVAKKSKVLTRDQIMSAPDIEVEEVDVPEWGGTVLIKPLSGAGRDAFEASVVEEKNGKTVLKAKNFRARLVSRCIVDENGLRLFTDEDVNELGRKSAKALNRLFEACQVASGMSQKDVESLEGNSDGPDDDSSSD